MRKVEKAKLSSKEFVHQRACVYFEEVASNLYVIRKHRHAPMQGKFVDAVYVAKEVNSGFQVAIQKIDGELLANFTLTPYREFLVDSLYREII